MEWAHDHEIHWSYHGLSSCQPDRVLTDLLKVQLEYKFGGDTL